jgi:hypothetical protein
VQGTGVFFNQLIDLSRFETLATEGKIDWIAPLMAPDQDSVQLNRKEWSAWRAKLSPHGVKMLPWLACDNINHGDPVQNAETANWLVANYKSDGLVFNCEKAYEDVGKWRGYALVQEVMSDVTLAGKPKILSFPSTPAERYDMDYRAFERSGFWFAPQAYWNDPTIIGDATPKTLYQSTYLPGQVHVNRDYRLQIFGRSTKSWGRVVQWDGGTECIVKDYASAKMHRLRVQVKSQGSYKYMVNLPDRKLYDYKTGVTETGRLLGFQVREKIVPTVGAYDSCPTTPAEITTQLDKISNLKGASLYLGDTSTSAHVKAVWTALHN